MSRKRYTPEQIISMLREAEVALAQGQLNRNSGSRVAFPPTAAVRRTPGPRRAVGPRG